MTIKEVEKKLNITRANIRFYEKEGLLQPKRCDNEYRDYSEDDLKRLEKILIFRKCNISIENIRLIFNGVKNLDEVFKEQISVIENEVKQLNGAKIMCKKLSQEKSSVDTLDTDKYINIINSEEQKGNRFYDIADDYIFATEKLYQSIIENKEFKGGDIMKKGKKVIFLIIIFMLIVGFIFINNKTDFVSKIKGEVEEEKNSDNKNNEEVKNPSKEVLKEEDVKSKTSLDIETPSGAVLIGSIKRDNEGWYFMPIQPLNITLTYYVEHEEKFENIIKLRMLDDEEDNFQKSVYNNEIVTVYGEILNPRSLGVLYLYPYNIKSGKQVETSYAEPSITAPSNDFGEMDESLLSSKMNSKIINDEYKYNFYMVSKETLYRFDNDFINFYLEFVDAFLNYKTSIKCPNKSYADYIFSILDYQFPVFYADGVYDFSNIYNKNNKTINWSYTSNSKKEHDELINNFLAEANKLLEGVNVEQSDNKKAQIIYHNLSKVITYNYEALDNFKNTESYYVYTKHTGICHSFAYAYNQLLTQVGIESTLALGHPNNYSIGHAWSVIKIDGTYYFADPTYELGYKNGTAYKFYGMGIKERESTNEYYEDNIVIGMYDSKPMKNYGNFDKNLPILE